MGKDNSIGILILFGIIAIALFGGTKNSNNSGGFLSSGKKPTTQKEVNVQKETQRIENEIEKLKKQIQAEEDKKTQSQYKDIVSISSVSRSTDPSKEYITIKVSSRTTTTIPVTGWILKSINSGVQVSIPKGTYLFFTGMMNTEDNIYLNAGDVVYLVTGISPNGASFKTNKCSGYLGQFQTFVPYLRNDCPRPKNEDMSSIPKLAINDACFDYINSMSQCRIQTKPLPSSWSYECTNFIYQKINYASCVNTHKNDSDFYKKEWRVYLKRGSSLWKTRKETIVLYDSSGKVVDTIQY
jgi:hypothetical protein